MQRAVDFVANIFKSLEELSHPDAVIILNFPRSIQLDGYSCGAKSVYTILRYLKRRCTIASVERALKTTWEGTEYSDIKRVIRERGLLSREVTRMRDLKQAIGQGSPVIVSLFQNWHWSVVYGYSGDDVVFVMNPSLNPFSMGALSVVVQREDFLKIWDAFGMAISERK